MPLTDQLCTDLTEQAQEGKLDPLIGRQKEIERVIQILTRQRRNSLALIGEPGVGKTTIVKGLAQKIAAGEVPQVLQGKRVLTLDVGSLVAGTIYRGQFEERMKRVIDEMKNSGALVYISNLTGFGADGSSEDRTRMLVSSLLESEIQCIIETTADEYEEHVVKYRGLWRNLQRVFIEESSIEDTIEILKSVRPRYEQYYNVRITDSAIVSAVQLAVRYSADRYLPDKALDRIDEAASRVQMHKIPDIPGLKETFAELKKIQEQKEEAFGKQHYEEAVLLRGQEVKLREHIEQLRLSAADEHSEILLQVTDADIADMQEQVRVALLKSPHTVLEVPTEIRDSLKKFKEDYPESTKTAFILMRFGTTRAHREIIRAIKETLARHGIVGLRADDKEYHTDLFPNVMTYMYGCAFGVAVFERIEVEQFNPNVALEVGYMLAMGKPVCLLRDKTLATLQTDLIGKLYKSFDPQDPQATVPSQLVKWLIDRSVI